MTSPLLGLFFGFLNTTTIHLAKGLQRQGIRTLKWFRQAKHERSVRHAMIYIVGVILNNSTIVWVLLTNRYAAPAYISGMFGLGLVVLLVYSRVVLHEPVVLPNYVGAVLVVLGTLAFGYVSLTNPDIDVSLMSPRAVGIFAGSFFIIAVALLVLANKSSRAQLKGMAFGLIAGGLGGLDPVLKGLGQHAGGLGTILPDIAWGWIPFGISFIFGTTAFLTVQLGFHRGADASVLVPMHSCTYVLIPVISQLVCLPGYDATPMLITGVTLIVWGIVLIQRRPKVRVGGDKGGGQ